MPYISDPLALNNQSSLCPAGSPQLFLNFLKITSHTVHSHKSPRPQRKAILGWRMGVSLQTGPSLGRGWQSSGLEAFAIGYSTGTGPLTHWGWAGGGCRSQSRALIHLSTLDSGYHLPHGPCKAYPISHDSLGVLALPDLVSPRL